MSVKKFKARETKFLTRLTQVNLFQIHISIQLFWQWKSLQKKHSLKEKTSFGVSEFVLLPFFHRNKAKKCKLSFYFNLFPFSKEQLTVAMMCGKSFSMISDFKGGNLNWFFLFIPTALLCAPIPRPKHIFASSFYVWRELSHACMLKASWKWL